MWAVSNLFRASAAIRRHMEANVLAADRLSWTAFTGLWVLWIWGEMETRDFAAAVGISRPTATGVITTLEGRGWCDARRMRATAAWCWSRSPPAGKAQDRAAVPPVQRGGGRGDVAPRCRLSRTRWRGCCVRCIEPWTEWRLVRYGLGQHDADRHALDAVHEVRADPFDRARAARWTQPRQELLEEDFVSSRARCAPRQKCGPPGPNVTWSFGLTRDVEPCRGR